MHAGSVANAIRKAQKQEDQARKSGRLAAEKQLLRIAVWRHAVAGPEAMADLEFLGHLEKNGVRIAPHGDVHEMRRDLIGHWRPTGIHIVGSGSFGSPAVDLPESTPRLYNVLEVSRDLKAVRVHTRYQPKPDAAWRGWNEWPRQDDSDAAMPYYDIQFCPPDWPSKTAPASSAFRPELDPPARRAADRQIVAKH